MSTMLQVAIDYTNHRGERRWRVITPHSIAFTTSPWHREEGQQWFLHAWDVAKNAKRDFPMTRIHRWLAPKGFNLPEGADVPEITEGT